VSIRCGYHDERKRRCRLKDNHAGECSFMKQHIELEAYLRDQMEEGKHAFRIVPRKAEGGKLVVYIHPRNADGDSRDFEVGGNSVQDVTKWFPES